MVEILEHIDAEHSIERFAETFKITGVRGIEFPDLDVRGAQKAIAEGVQVERILFPRDIVQAASHQTPADVSDSSAQFEDRIAEKWAKLARQPAQILRRAGEVI